MAKILFLDQSGKIGGAELSLMDVAKSYQSDCLVGLLADGSFRTLLQQQKIPVQVLTTREVKVRKESSLLQGLLSLLLLLPVIVRLTRLSRSFDLIYANTQKALVVGAIASIFSGRRLVYHLRDIVSPEHFSRINRRLIVTLANLFATQVIANSQATAAAFIESGGRKGIVSVVYNGFDPQKYQVDEPTYAACRQELDLTDRFVVGHFSRLSPWKGQHVLIEALTYCPEEVTAVLVGDALFGEQEYVESLHRQVNELGLSDRVRFLGFRSDVPTLMSACDLIAHTSTAAEPFGRVVIEAMLSNRPVVAAGAGGVTELVEHGVNGWLCPPNDARKLAEIICACRETPTHATAIAHQGKQQAIERFNQETMHQSIASVLNTVFT